MAIGSGLAGQIGYAEESTVGTYVAPTRFADFESESLQKKKNVVQGSGLAAGRFAQLSARRIVATTWAEGGFTQDARRTGMGILLKHALGDSSPTVAQQAATAAYLQTHTIGDNYGLALTVQKGVPDTTGTVRPYSYLGGKIKSLEVSCDTSDIAKVEVDMDFISETEGQSLATASYGTADAPFHFGEMTVKLGTYASEASVSGVKSASIKIERPMDTERFYAGNAGVKDQAIMNDYVAVSGSFTVDYETKADFADRFSSDAATALVLEWVGATAIESTYFPTLRFTVPAIHFDDGTPVVDSAGIVSTQYSFVGLDDGTNDLITAEYMSTDTAV